MASPPTAADLQAARARAALDESRARIAAVMATAPWPDPADLRPGPLQAAAWDRVTAARTAVEASATVAVAMADELRSRVGIVARVLAAAGLDAPSVHAARQAGRVAEEAQQVAWAIRLSYREDLARADLAGVAEARGRQAQQDQWEGRPDVRAARREARGNDLVVAATRNGDPAVQAALWERNGLQLARGLLLQLEVKRLATEGVACQVNQGRRHTGRMVGHVPETVPKPDGLRH